MGTGVPSRKAECAVDFTTMVPGPSEQTKVDIPLAVEGRVWHAPSLVPRGSSSLLGASNNWAMYVAQITKPCLLLMRTPWAQRRSKPSAELGKRACHRCADSAFACKIPIAKNQDGCLPPTRAVSRGSPILFAHVRRGQLMVVSQMCCCLHCHQGSVRYHIFAEPMGHCDTLLLIEPMHKQGAEDLSLAADLGESQQSITLVVGSVAQVVLVALSGNKTFVKVPLIHTAFLIRAIVEMIAVVGWPIPIMQCRTTNTTGQQLTGLPAFPFSREAYSHIPENLQIFFFLLFRYHLSVYPGLW